jgi:hypothetical protein
MQVTGLTPIATAREAVEKQAAHKLTIGPK